MSEPGIKVTRKIGDIEYQLIRYPITFSFGGDPIEGWQESWVGQTVTCTDCKRSFTVSAEDDMYAIEGTPEAGYTRVLCNACFQEAMKATKRWDFNGVVYRNIHSGF